MDTYGSSCQYAQILAAVAARIAAGDGASIGASSRTRSRDAYEIYRLLGSAEKQLVTLHRSYHVVMKDHDQEEVFARTLAFVQRYTNVARPQSAIFDGDQQDKLA